MTIDFKGVFRNKNREQRKINDLERLESRIWVKLTPKAVYFVGFGKAFTMGHFILTYQLLTPK